MLVMNRLPLELDRLYGLRPSPRDGLAAEGVGEAGLGHGMRAAVLAVSLPAGWRELSTVWRGVQSDLELPAPAIAVSGIDALQLWFSFASPTSASEGTRFLQGLRARYLSEVGSSHVRLCSESAELPVAPCVEITSQRWSAFVTHDLASVFAETPWLDIPATDEGQATILRALEPIQQVAFEAALNKLGAIKNAMPLEPPASERAGAGSAEIAGQRDSDPARFLSGVMKDETAPLALRIEAARILLADAKRS